MSDTDKPLARVDTKAAADDSRTGGQAPASADMELPWRLKSDWKGIVSAANAVVIYDRYLSVSRLEFIITAVNSHDALVAALQELLLEPHGCPFCDSGTLRNPAKGHTHECGFEMARKALAQVNG